MKKQYRLNISISAELKERLDAFQINTGLRVPFSKISANAIESKLDEMEGLLVNKEEVNS